jgi:hypothetical protein
MSKQKGPLYVVEEHTASGMKRQTYEGFSHIDGTRCDRPEWATYLAVTFLNGEVGMWWLQGDGLPVEELRRLFRMMEESEVIIKLFVPHE